MDDGLTCNGGYQAYCCSGFQPSSKTNTGDLALYGQGNLAKRSARDLVERGKPGATVGGAALGVAACVATVEIANLALAFFTFGLSLIGAAAGYTACAAAGGAIGYIASGSGNTKQPAPNKPVPPASHNIGSPVQPLKKKGQ
jgi:chitinase